MATAKQIKNKLTVENIVDLCCHLQGISPDDCLFDAQGHPIFNTCLCHDGDSDKLYYYPESQLFRCYTCSSTKDIFEIVQHVKHCDFKEALDFIVDYFHIKQRGFEEKEPKELTGDWDIFQKIQDYKAIEKKDQQIPNISENMLEYFYPLAAPVEWLNEGISADVMYYYGIRVDTALHKVIIPHRRMDGKLIGIRGRSYDPLEIVKGKKYMPVFIQGDIYSHPLGQNLFGIYENQDIIRHIKKVCVFEAEKSVMQISTMYGIENCFAVATCGSSFSSEQMDLLLNLGVEEIIIAYDADHKGKRGDPDTVEYETKLYNIAKPLLPYVNVSIIFDYDHILPWKASPSDFGKEKFEELYHKRIKLKSISQKMDRTKYKKG